MERGHLLPYKVCVIYMLLFYEHSNKVVYGFSDMIMDSRQWLLFANRSCPKPIQAGSDIHYTCPVIIYIYIITLWNVLPKWFLWNNNYSSWPFCKQNWLFPKARRQCLVFYSIFTYLVLWILYCEVDDQQHSQ